MPQHPATKLPRPRAGIGCFAGALIAATVAGIGALWLSTPLGWRAIITLAPGEERHDAAALDAPFRDCLDGLLARLAARGYRPVLRATWRDADRQRFYHALGGSQRADNSHHQHTRDGQPAARAADISDLWPLLHTSHHAAFYLDMMRDAPAYGLRTGGTWKKTAPRWAAYGLGWDPGHVEAAPGRCDG